jgi:hypothetical protein
MVWLLFSSVEEKCLGAQAIGLGLGNRPDTGPAVVVKSVLAGGAAARSGKVRAPPAPLLALRRACLASRCLVLVRPHKDKTPVIRCWSATSWSPSTAPPSSASRCAPPTAAELLASLRMVSLLLLFFSAPLPPPPSRTNWTRLVPPTVLNGHVSGGAAAADGARLAHTPRRLQRAPARRAPA